MASLHKRLVFARPARVDLGLLLLRLWFGLVLALAHGLHKLGNLQGFVSAVEQNGIPLPLPSAVFAVLGELVGGTLLALGLFTRAAGLSVAATLSVAAFWVHRADPFAKMEFALAYAVVGLALAITGPGRFSLDGKRR